MSHSQLTRDAFLWTISLVYLFAFGSLYVQIPGLYGDNGILPAKIICKKAAKDIFEFVHEPNLISLLTSIGFSVSAAVDSICLGGLIVSFVSCVSFTYRGPLTYAFLWLSYYSLFQIGQTFLWFQWDILLLETGFLSIILAPFTLNFRSAKTKSRPHDLVNLWLIKWLLFRLMFASGVVKLTSRCPTWWSLTALNYHYESQCLPTPLAWHFHHLPEWFQKFSVSMVYIIEIIVPFLFFSPRKLHQILAAILQILLQILIIATGNYNFFNLLTVFLCIPLLNDSIIKILLRPFLPLKSFRYDDDNENELNDKLEKSKNNGSLTGALKNFSGGIIRVLLVYAFDAFVILSIVYWSIIAFDYKINYEPFSIDSKVNFTLDNFLTFLRGTVPLSIWVASISLVATIWTATINCFRGKSYFFRKIISLLNLFIYSIIAIGMFSLSLPEHTVVDKVSYSHLWNVLHKWNGATDKYQIVNSYGLFRSMTGVGGRPEVIIEASKSADGPWFEYDFRYKPGDISIAPKFNLPHQPRLDWQMWFAALGEYQGNPWLLNLVYRLLKHEKDVLQLLGDDPMNKFRTHYKDDKPSYIRILLYRYKYVEKNVTGNWWTRSLTKQYLPVLGIDDDGFQNYLKSAGILNQDKSKPNTNFIAKIVVIVREIIGQPEGFKWLMSLLICVIIFNIIKSRR